MRSRPLVAAVVVVLALAGCNERRTTSAEPLPPRPAVTEPAAAAGGACILWDYDFIKQKLGVTFAVAASDQVDDTSTCVLQTIGADFPDLTLAVVESTKADGTQFIKDLMPAKGQQFKGLGKAAYRLISPGNNVHGPSVEFSWLSEANQLQTLIYTFAPGATTPTVNSMAAKMLSLAQAMDTTAG